MYDFVFYNYIPYIRQKSIFRIPNVYEHWLIHVKTTKNHLKSICPLLLLSKKIVVEMDWKLYFKMNIFYIVVRYQTVWINIIFSQTYILSVCSPWSFFLNEILSLTNLTRTFFFYKKFDIFVSFIVKKKTLSAIKLFAFFIAQSSFYASRSALNLD